MRRMSCCRIRQVRDAMHPAMYSGKSLLPGISAFVDHASSVTLHHSQTLRLVHTAQFPQSCKFVRHGVETNHRGGTAEVTRDTQYNNDGSDETTVTTDTTTTTTTTTSWSTITRSSCDIQVTDEQYLTTGLYFIERIESKSLVNRGMNLVGISLIKTIYVGDVSNRSLLFSRIVCMYACMFFFLLLFSEENRVPHKTSLRIGSAGMCTDAASSR